MDSADLHDLLGDLTANIDDLESTLLPLTQKPLTSTASKLPLLDKAKLHVLATYALESILFNSLRLNGTDAKAHPVFAELNRVKEYFGKIKAAEGTGAKPTARVDTEAAGRFIRAGLAGNEKLAGERGGAKRKAEELGGDGGTATRFDGAAKRIRTAEGLVQSGSGHVSADEGEGGVALDEDGSERKSKRRNKPSDAQKKAEKRERRQKAKEAKLSPHATSDAATQGEAEAMGDGEETVEKSSKPPKSSREALDTLLSGASSKLEKKGRKKKKKSKGQALEDERADEMK